MGVLFNFQGIMAGPWGPVTIAVWTLQQLRPASQFTLFCQAIIF